MKNWVLIFVIVIFFSCDKEQQEKVIDKNYVDSISLSKQKINVANLNNENSTVSKEEKKYSFNTDFLNNAERAKKLTYLYEQANNANIDSVREKSRIEFFRTFPDDFDTFNSIYGWKGWPDDSTKGMLYEEHFDQIIFFNELSLIPQKIYIKKLIELSKNGMWDADAVSMMQHGLRKKMKEKSKIFRDVLNNYSHSIQKSFWYFYFDGPHPPKEIPEYLAFIQEANPEMYTLIEETLKQVQNDWKDH